MYVTMDKAKRQPVTQSFKSLRKVYYMNQFNIYTGRAPEYTDDLAQYCLSNSSAKNSSSFPSSIIFVDCAVLYIVAFRS